MENNKEIYLTKLAKEMNKHTYFHIKLDNDDEYIVQFYAEYEAEVEFLDDSTEDIHSFAFKVLKVINNLSSGYEFDDIIEVNIYNLITSIRIVNGEDYIKDEKLKKILSFKRIMNIDEDILYHTYFNRSCNELGLKNVILNGK